MLQILEFIAIVKVNYSISERQLKTIFESQKLIETTLSNNQIKVLTFRGNRSKFYTTKSWFESPEISRYLTLIDIGLAPDYEIETIAYPQLLIDSNYHKLALRSTIISKN